MMNRKSIFLMLILMFAVGCSSKVKLEDLVLSGEDLGKTNQFDVAVSVDAIGGFNGLVSSELFKTALVDSIGKSKLFASIDTSSDPRYELLVVILRFEIYSLGHDGIVTSKWILQKDDEEIWSEIVTGNGVSNTFAGVTRMRESIERAGKDNIRNGLQMIGNISPQLISE